MDQTDYGVMPVALLAVLTAAGARYANAYYYSKYLNARYNFHSFTPEEAVGQIALAVDQKPLDRLFLTTKARLAPEGTVQARVKAAYLLALTSRYLQNPTLAEAATIQIEQARKEQNSRNAEKIESILYQAGKKIQAAAGEKAYTDSQIQIVLFTLGVEVRKKQRNVKDDVKQAQSSAYRLDPRKEAEQSTQELIDVPSNLIRKSGNLLRSGKERYDLEKARTKRNLYTGLAIAVGLPIIAFAFWPRKGK